MAKNQEIAKMLEIAADKATIEQLNTIINARDIQIDELKAQVNALRDSLSAISIMSESSLLDYATNLADSALDKAPAQCLKAHDKALIHRLIDEKSIENEYTDQLIMVEDVEEFIKELGSE